MPEPSTLPTGSTLPLTSSHHDKDAATVVVTLRSLYSRAARAFLQRDINLTFTLITSAFLLIPSPPPLDDPLAAWRRKWDILRITLETMVYAIPPADPESLPPHLCANLMLSPQSLLAALDTRSLMLFTPVLPDSQIQDSLNAVYLPTQVLLTLALASMKLGVPDVGRGIIEDWLARRDGHQDVGSEDGEGYGDIIELYCLHILPRLGEWEYATEFLQYEGQLKPARRQRLISSLDGLHSKTVASLQQGSRTPSTPSLSPSSTTFSRPISPSGSSESSSSEQTATPRTPRPDADDPKGKRKALPMSMTSISTSSVSESTNTSRTPTPMPSQVVGKPKYKNKRRYSVSRAPVLDPPISESSTEAPSTLAVIKSAFFTAKASFIPRIGFATLLILALGLLSLVQFRRSRRRPRITNGGASADYTLRVPTRVDRPEEMITIAGSAIDEVRKKLTPSSGASGLSAGILRLLWNEAVRIVGDTVRMGGRGLV